jgi:hypothetical protein
MEQSGDRIVLAIECGHCRGPWSGRVTTLEVGMLACISIRWTADACFPGGSRARTPGSSISRTTLQPIRMAGCTLPTGRITVFKCSTPGASLKPSGSTWHAPLAGSFSCPVWAGNGTSFPGNAGLQPGSRSHAGAWRSQVQPRHHRKLNSPAPLACTLTRQVDGPM